MRRIATTVAPLGSTIVIPRRLGKRLLRHGRYINCTRFAGPSSAAFSTCTPSVVAGRQRPPALLPRPTTLARASSSLPAPAPPSSPQTNDDDPHAHLVPVDFTTASQISGEESHILEVRLRPNQVLRAESGAMLYMTEGVSMETTMGTAGGGGGMSVGLTRMMTGQNLMVSDFTFAPTSEGGDGDRHGTVGLGTDFPAKILRLSLADFPDCKLICQKGAFLAGSHTVRMEMSYTKSFTGGFFGGEGFILQSLQGAAADDTAFLKAYGTVLKRELSAGESLRVASGSLVAMTGTVDYDVTRMPGFKNVVFGGEGLFVTTLTGPGTVWLQGMPVDRMIGEIARKIPRGGGIGLGIPIMGGGGGGVEGGDAGADGAAAAGTEGAGGAATEAAAGAERLAADPASPESLFGDAAYGGGNAPSDSASPPGNDGADSAPSDDGFNTFAQPDGGDTPEFEEPTVEEPRFEDDGTTFSTYDGDSSSGGEPGMPEDEEGPGLLRQLWDFFSDNE